MLFRKKDGTFSRLLLPSVCTNYRLVRVFTGRDGTDPRDPLYGLTKIKELYLKAEPTFTGRYTVPVLWDKKRETIVNNESSEIIRMFFTAFDGLLPPERRESAHGFGGYYPEGALRGQIDELNDWVYNTVNSASLACAVRFAS